MSSDFRKDANLDLGIYRSLADNSMEFIGMCDLNFMPFYVNPAGMRLVGLDNLEQCLQTPVREFFFPEDQHFILKEFFPRVLSEGHSDVEIRFRHFKTGSAIWMLYNVFFIEDSIGKPVGLATVSRDISARKQAKMLLRKSETEFRTMFELASVGMVQVDSANGTFLRVNEHLCAMIGYAAAELAGKCYVDYSHPDDRQRDCEMFSSLVRGDIEKSSIEKRLLHKDGSTVWCKVNITTIRDHLGKPQYNLAIIENINNRKLAENLAKQSKKELTQAYWQLQKSEAKNRYLSDLLKQADQPFGIGYPNGKLGYFNRAFERLTGYSRDELLVMNWATELTPPEWEKLEQAKLQELIHSGRPVRYEKEYIRKDGSRVPIELVVDMKTDDEGRPLHYYAFVTDLTERKLTESKLLEADRSKDEFLAMLAHELRNPLAPIKNAIHILGMLKLEDPRLQWVQEIIERQVTHLTRMVDDLLDTSRIARGKILLKKEPLDIAEAVNQAVKSVHHLIVAKLHALEVSLPEKPIMLEGDPVRLIQVLVNLLDNAVKYSPEGGQIKLDVLRIDAEVEIRIQDSGCGIPSGLLPKIFDLFQQAERTLDRSQGGLGIGLTLAKRLVELHEGRITAASQGAGQGSTFSIRLPVLPETAGLPASKSIISAMPQVPIRVLVVDDDSAVRETTAVLLTMEGHEVCVADTGEKAIKLVEEFHPDVVLLDIGLPGEDGYQVARRIRKLPCGSGLLLVAVSGYGQPEILARSQSAGFNHHLIKPVDINALLNLLSVRELSSTAETSHHVRPL